MKCRKCGYATSYISHYEYSMKRVYLRRHGNYKGVGWICPYCIEIILDKKWKKLLGGKLHKVIYVRWKNTYKKIGLLWYDKEVHFEKKLQIKPKRYKTHRIHK